MSDWPSECLPYREEWGDGHCDCYDDGKPCCHCEQQKPLANKRRRGRENGGKRKA